MELVVILSVILGSGVACCGIAHHAMVLCIIGSGIACCWQQNCLHVIGSGIMYHAAALHFILLALLFGLQCCTLCHGINEENSLHGPHWLWHLWGGIWKLL